MRTNPKNQHTKSRAHLNQYKTLLTKERNTKLNKVQIHIPTKQRLNNSMIKTKKLRKNFNNQLLIKNLSFSLPPTNIINMIGPNSTNKTTLFQMIINQKQPNTNALKLNSTVNLTYVDQSRNALDPNKTI